MRALVVVAPGEVGPGVGRQEVGSGSDRGEHLDGDPGLVHRFEPLAVDFIQGIAARAGPIRTGIAAPRHRPGVDLSGKPPQREVFFERDNAHLIHVVGMSRVPAFRR